MSDSSKKRLSDSANSLAEKINVLRKNATESELYSFSDLVMGLLRAEHLFINQEVINSFKNKSFATIDPDDVESDFNGTDIQPVFANSFGPWNSKEYFNLKGNKNEPRLMWILKEPYIKEETWYTNQDRGGHNQAAEYYAWEILDCDTHINIVKISKAFLDCIFEKELDYNEVMKHICIVELNHFPGLAFQSPNTDNNLIAEWAKINSALIRSLVDFYSPNLILGSRDTLYPLAESESINSPENKKDKIDLFNWLASRESSKDADFTGRYNCSILKGRRLFPIKEHKKEIFSQTKKEYWKKYVTAVIDDRNTFWVNCNHHPACRSWNGKNINGSFLYEEFSHWVASLFGQYYK